MIIGVPKESRAGEPRVAATPETVKKLVAAGQQVLVEAGAGAGAFIPDAEYSAAGATIANSDEVWGRTEVVLKVRAPNAEETARLASGAAVIGLFSPHNNPHLDAYAAKGINAFSLELLPRITRAQSMDVLSSQANIAGYKAVLLATHYYQKFMPMLMTAAGTVKPARVLVLGAGVAGLQAIATAKRLGAVVEAFDVRPAVKEQVESLGAKFVEVALSDEEKKAAETAGGYAREMSDDYKRRQGELIDKHARAADIIITTALIPGRAAPVLIKEEVARSMKPGSVIIDLAAEAGGNCPLTKVDEVINVDGVTIVGHSNLPGLVAADASALYARNVLTFLTPMLDKESGKLKIDTADELISATRIVGDGQVLYKKPN